MIESVEHHGLIIEWNPEHECEGACEYCVTKTDVRHLRIQGFDVKCCRSCFERMFEDRHIFQIEVRAHLRTTLN